MRATKDLSKKNNNHGITLIALVITIIVMLILVAVTITMAVNGGLFGKAADAGRQTNEAVKAEQELGSGKVKIKDGTTIYEYDNINAYFTNTPSKVYEEGEISEEPEKYDFSYKIGDNVTVYLTKNEEATANEKENDSWFKSELYDAIIVGTGDMWSMNMWPEELVEYYGGIYGANYQWNYYLYSVVISKGITNITDGAFGRSYYLKTVTIPEGINYIGDAAFCECSALTAINIPDSVESLGQFTFLYCYNMKNVTLGKRLKVIPYSCFYCTGIEKLSLHEGITSIEARAFEGCLNLTIEKFPDSLNEIGDDAFRGSAIEKIVFSSKSSLEKIGNAAFADCPSLIKVVFPVSLESIGESFYTDRQCEDAVFYYRGTKEQWDLVTIGKYNGKLSSGDITFNYTDTN